MIETVCQTCGSKLRAREDAVGKRGSCPKCGTVLIVSHKRDAKQSQLVEGVVVPSVLGTEDESDRGGLTESVTGSEAGGPTLDVSTRPARLTACPDCGQQVSRVAPACPHCGRPLQPAHESRGTGAVRAEHKRTIASQSETRTRTLLLTFGVAVAGVGLLASVISPEFATFSVVVAVLCGLVWLGGLPGSIARSRGHPNASAISVCGWVGIITFGVFWLVALVWAYTNPKGTDK